MIASARAPQFGIRLNIVDHGHEIIEPQQPLELEARAFITNPDAIRFDSADRRKTDDHAIAPAQIAGIIDHEALSRNIDNMHRQIAALAMLDDDWKIHWMPRGTAQVRYGKLSSTSHVTRIPLLIFKG